MQSIRCSCQTIIQLKFFRQTFEKSSYIKIHEIQSCGSRVVPCRERDGRMDRRTDKHKEANSGFSQFCEKRLKSILFLMAVASIPYLNRASYWKNKARPLFLISLIAVKTLSSSWDNVQTTVHCSASTRAHPSPHEQSDCRSTRQFP
jgi:hypothetical protein